MTTSYRQALQTARTLGLSRLDAQLLLLHALGRPDSDRAWLVAHDDEPLSQHVAETFQRLSLRCAAGEPLAYIVGYKDFFGLRFGVDARVLVPRPDTETLVQWALDQANQTTPTPTPVRLVDLGTGSGAIAIAIALTLAKHCRPATVHAVDASAAALTVAACNAAALRADVQWIESHWFDNLSAHYHVIASNPPYIASADPHLSALTHEPLEALTAGTDGLDDLRQIIAQAPLHLLPGGWLLLEHGYDQAEAVCALLVRRGFSEVQCRYDLAGIARCSGGQWRCKK